MRYVSTSGLLIRTGFGLTGGGTVESEAFYRQVLVADARDATALYFLGVHTLQAGRPKEAVELLQRALTEQPRSPVILNAMALGHELCGDLAISEAACGKALRASPDYGEAWHNLGNVLRKLGRSVEAAEAHANAARLLPGEPAVHGALGMALLDVGKLDEAIVSFRARAQVDPSPAAESAVLF